MGQSERDSLLAAVLEAIGDLREDTPSRKEFADLARTVALQGDGLEEVRKNAKGANNWGKMATTIGPVLTVLATALIKAMGWA